MVDQTFFDSNRELNLVTLWTLCDSIIIVVVITFMCVFYGSYKIAPKRTDREGEREREKERRPSVR